MKLKLFETIEEFENLPHTSTNDRLERATHKVAALKKEQAHYEEVKDNFHNVHHQKALAAFQKRTGVTNTIGFYNSPEGSKVANDLENAMNKLALIEKKLSKAKAELFNATHNDLFDKQKAENNVYNDTNKIPLIQRIPTGVTRSTNNPYFSSLAKEKWAGAPWDYPWWDSASVEVYKKLIKYLKNNNLSGFDTMYACKTTTGTNFIMIGDKGYFLWSRITQKGSDRVKQSTVMQNGVSTKSKEFIAKHNL